MTKWVLGLLVAAVGCSGGRSRPAGPAPEYERPEVAPWDAGKPADPLDQVEGEEVTDDEPPSGDAAKPAPGDAAASASDAGDAAG